MKAKENTIKNKRHILRDYPIVQQRLNLKELFYNASDALDKFNLDVENQVSGLFRSLSRTSSEGEYRPHRTLTEYFVSAVDKLTDSTERFMGIFTKTRKRAITSTLIGSLVLGSAYYAKKNPSIFSSKAPVKMSTLKAR
jgi:hypothetical protein